MTPAASAGDTQTFVIIGAAMEVHSILGSRFLEPVYQAALNVELERRGIPHAREVELSVYYKDFQLPVKYRVDFVCFGDILVELKAIDRLTSKESSQVINYLAASRLQRGLLLNFGAASLQCRRFVGRSRE
jgi:GxxExxY protein